MVRSFVDPGAALRALRPERPIHCVRPHEAEAAARRFIEGFAGEVLYAVKANPTPAVLRALVRGGVRGFDAASLEEVALVRSLFGAGPRIAFMHPVKSVEAIATAWRDHGVRAFAFDHADELEKILGAVTDPARLLGVLRLRVDDDGAALPLSAKFGASAAEAPPLLRAAAARCGRVGITFHVGSQCTDPLAWGRAIAAAAGACRAAGVVPAVIDVGGGFPATYPDAPAAPAPWAVRFAIDDALRCAGLAAGPALWCEPGRALVADAGSILARVELRKGDTLYLNDGTYGALFDAGAPGFTYPVRRWRPDAAGGADRGATPFRLFGPTCDAIDAMAGPFALPADVAAGDWIEFGLLGAYGATMASRFNGFGQHVEVLVEDAALTTLASGGAPPRPALAEDA